MDPNLPNNTPQPPAPTAPGAPASPTTPVNPTVFGPPPAATPLPPQPQATPMSATPPPTGTGFVVPPVQPPAQPGLTPNMPPAPAPFGQPAAPMGPQAPLGPSPTTGGNKSKAPLVVGIVVGAIVLISLLGGAAYVVLNKQNKSSASKTSGSNSTSQTDGSASNSSGDVVDQKSGTLDLSNLIDGQQSIKEQDLQAKQNQQVNLSDGTSYMVTSVDRNYTPASRYLRASNGKELIKVNLVVGNRKQTGNRYFSSSYFKLKNSAGGLQTAKYVSQSDVPDALGSQDVAPGKQAKGSIVYEVDKDEKVGAITTQDTYKFFTSKKVVTVKSTVSLQ